MRRKSRKIVEFSDYWLSKAAEARLLPSYRAILPEEIFRLLPNMAVFEVIDQGADFLCRVVGQSLAENYGAQDMGRLLSAMIADNPSLSVFHNNFLRVVESRQPLAVIDHFQSAFGTPRKTMGIAAPLSDDDETVTHIICCSIYVENGDLGELDQALSSRFTRVENVA